VALKAGAGEFGGTASILGSGDSLSRDGEEGGAIVAEINITPLTDLFLILLIIFMVTSSVLTQSSVQVQLPQASSGASSSQPEGVIVTLLPGGGMQILDQVVPAGQYARLEALLKKSFQKTRSKLVILEGDKQAFLGSAIEVMDHARKAGAERFAIATAQASGSGESPPAQPASGDP
jgi:biopolymer transport protein ExbD